MSIQPRPDIMQIMPYIGGEAKADGATRLVRLASNENAHGFSNLVAKAYQDLATELHRYPDGSAIELRTAIAKQYDLNVDKIVCGAGSEEIISMLIRSYAGQGDEILYSKHGFLMYPIGAKIVGATPVAAEEDNLRTDINALLDQVTDKTKILFVANPNNPTGSYITDKEMRELRDNLRDDVLLVIDSAYAEYVTKPDYACGKDMVDEYDNVVMLRTFSKIYGLAGLRLGWSYCPPDIADVLNRVRGPFNANLVAQAAGIAALQDQEFIKKSIKHNAESLELVASGLDVLGIENYPSVCNFILAKFGENSEDARLFLKSKGVLIRQMGVYDLHDCLRISLGTTEENQILLETIKEYKS